MTRVRASHFLKASDVFFELCLLKTISGRREAILLFTARSDREHDEQRKGSSEARRRLAPLPLSL